MGAMTVKLEQAPRRGSARSLLALSGLALLALGAAQPSWAQPNPLTETPGRAADPSPSRPPDRDAVAEAQATSPSATAIIRSLAPFADGNPNARPPGRAVRDVDVDDGGRKVRVDYGRSIDLTVFFGYDTAVLTPQAVIQLEPLGRALQSDALRPYRFLIAGHTDAAGDPRYNRRLSLQRALAVRGHLSEAYGVDPSRLVVHGWGQGRLKNPRQPFSGVNRRVEVALIERDRSSAYDHPARRLAAPLGGATIACGPDPWREAWRACPDRAAAECGRLSDPRRRLAAYALDDFGSAPTETGFGASRPGVTCADAEPDRSWADPD